MEGLCYSLFSFVYVIERYFTVRFYGKLKYASNLRLILFNAYLQAFSLPIIHSLLQNWTVCNNLRIPHALIIAPTRELALQISTVIREVCAAVQEICGKLSLIAETENGVEGGTTDIVDVSKLSKKAKAALKNKQSNLNKLKNKQSGGTGASGRAAVSIEVVSIVGGMSEQKQRRQLAGKGKPVHIVVATPGRLCEMFDDCDNVSFQDMSQLKFLVVDEADRIMEEGHYPEVINIHHSIPYVYMYMYLMLRSWQCSIFHNFDCT